VMTLSFNNAMCFLKDGPHLDATRGSPPHCASMIEPTV